MSRITSVVLLAKTLTAPLVPAATIAALDFVRPSSELSVEAMGRNSPAGHNVRKPSGPLGTTATFREYAWAVIGTPQVPAGITKSRLVPPDIAGPPNAPAARRVSTTRHGVIGTKRR